MFYAEIDKGSYVSSVDERDPSSVVREAKPAVHLINSFRPAVREVQTVSVPSKFLGVISYDKKREVQELDPNKTILEIGFSGFRTGGESSRYINRPTVEVELPYEAIKALAQSAMATGQILDLRRSNWENLKSQYDEGQYERAATTMLGKVPYNGPSGR